MKDATKIPRKILDDIEKGELRLTDIIVFYGSLRFAWLKDRGQFFCHIGESVGFDYRTVQTRLKVFEKKGYITQRLGNVIRFEVGDRILSAQTTEIRRVEKEEPFRFVPNSLFTLFQCGDYDKHVLSLVLYLIVNEFDDNTKGASKYKKRHYPSADELRTKTRLHYYKLKESLETLEGIRWVEKSGRGYKLRRSRISADIAEIITKEKAKKEQEQKQNHTILCPQTEIDGAVVPSNSFPGITQILTTQTYAELVEEEERQTREELSREATILVQQPRKERKAIEWSLI